MENIWLRRLICLIASVVTSIDGEPLAREWRITKFLAKTMVGSKYDVS